MSWKTVAVLLALVYGLVDLGVRGITQVETTVLRTRALRCARNPDYPGCEGFQTSAGAQEKTP